MVDEFPSNSNKSRESSARPERKKVEKVITGHAVLRKKPLGSRIAESFAGDKTRNVGQYILFDVALPAVKDLIWDMISQGLDVVTTASHRALFGEGRPTYSSRGGRGSGSYTPYNRIKGSAQTRGRGYREVSSRSRATHDFREVILESRGEGEEVLDRLGDLIEEYGEASVSDFYDLVDVTGHFTDDKWGWTDIRDARVERVREGYIVALPKPHPLD